MNTKYTLRLIKTKAGDYLCEAKAPGRELEFYDLDGEGGEASKTSLTPWNTEYQYVARIKPVIYQADDSNSFWGALNTIIGCAKEKNLELPEYA